MNKYLFCTIIFLNALNFHAQKIKLVYIENDIEIKDFLIDNNITANDFFIVNSTYSLSLIHI